MFAVGISANFSSGPAHVPFVIVEVLCWLVTVLLTTYSITIVSLSILTALTLDKDVWIRDITSSPSPFPLQHILATLMRTTSLEDDTRSQRHHCLPGCTCTEKQLPSSPPLAIPAIGQGLNVRMERAPARSNVPVRVPTAMERHNSIVIGFDV
ncbi:hypothetical protein HETIRDRAFT_169504 [Heterobasidion irregulare TC 32-1]|uniref:Uncharacterized protein n=1 Tax=Heterobasidion irregulare (strain TC 32-1) TaxID=747525 RepID=W4K5Z1_HETIT|nr:uncharacterized protein HETIRDRAFT_169504 [Heterobasidion irregulare TC 32-1]ETW80760.1 hypothetical protein HETIRDRAFT_169504 [Heterobasidion irregulare TC 32-1]